MRSHRGGIEPQALARVEDGRRVHFESREAGGEHRVGESCSEPAGHDGDHARGGQYARDPRVAAAPSQILSADEHVAGRDEGSETGVEVR